ncbi:MAG: hypothetical protein JWL91_2274 [Sphingomonas bacterium]|nr:O-antigen ligase family protein [Sphingomonas bacterium]MDB5690398.1 hypothetical protein [Sphingomonas bacterium]
MTNLAPSVRLPAGARVVVGRVQQMSLFQKGTLWTALVSLLFSANGSIGTPVQGFAVGLLGILAVQCVLTGRAKLTTFSIYDMVLGLMILMSLIVATQADNPIALVSVCALAICYMACLVLARSFSLHEILQVSALAFAGMAFLIAAFYPSDLLTTLTPSAAKRWTLRVGPFGLHPNLIGYMFGGGAICSIYALIRSRGLWFVAYLISTVICLMLPLAASSRAALLALVASAAVMFVPAVRGLSRFWKRAVLGAALLAFVLIVLKLGTIVAYLDEVLELSSKTRGLGTGGTGRVDLWKDGIDLILGGSLQSLFGYGFRGSGPEVIGFQTESSYITILLESGLVLGTIYLVLVFRMTAVTVVRSWAAGTRVSQTETFVGWLLVYAVLESVFNRYLLAVGNTMSLFLFLLLLKLSLSHARGSGGMARQR